MAARARSSRSCELRVDTTSTGKACEEKNPRARGRYADARPPPACGFTKSSARVETETIVERFTWRVILTERQGFCQRRRLLLIRKARFTHDAKLGLRIAPLGIAWPAPAKGWPPLAQTVTAPFRTRKCCAVLGRSRPQRFWCRRGESNPRPRDYETLALPLSYAGTRPFFMVRAGLK